MGCAGQFVLAGQGGYLHLTTDDEDAAIAACASGPVSCEVYDTVRREWIGPTCWEEIREAEQRLAARA